MQSYKKKKSKPQAELGKKPFDVAVKYLARKARTVREVERFLDAEEYGEFEVYQVIERLKELNYLNDASYAEEFVRSRLATKPISRMKLREQLLAHEISRDTVEEALLSITDEAERKNACIIAKKHAAQLRDVEDDEFEVRLLRRIVSRGYSHDDAKYAVSILDSEDE